MHRDVLEAIAKMIPENLPVEIPPRIFLDMEGDIIDYEEGHFLTIRFPVKGRYRNPMGHMQGGMIVAAIDNTFGPLSYLVAPPSVTTQLNTSYIRPVTTTDRHIDVVAEVEEKTGRHLFLSAEVLNPAGKPVALSHASCMILGVGRNEDANHLP
jgi:uncharacterized protein (TIGR00369 family)